MTFRDVLVVVLQGKMDAINVDKAVEFVLSCMNFDGGFGCRPGSESHAGQVRPPLGLSTLKKSLTFSASMKEAMGECVSPFISLGLLFLLCTHCINGER